ncbi:hypothetical protein [Burkholderia ubonensis]|uniref:hypothetical protein n=1 Tax=Burkholderia ubonensis TaxID=101571 RepID=UPI000A7A3152|nr:hypothetical protein [Burkholderia ubonensis]
MADIWGYSLRKIDHLVNAAMARRKTWMVTQASLDRSVAHQPDGKEFSKTLNTLLKE